MLICFIHSLERFTISDFASNTRPGDTHILGSGMWYFCFELCVIIIFSNQRIQTKQTKKKVE